MPSGNLALRNRQLTPRDSKHGHDSVRVRSLLRSSVIAFSASFEQVPTLYVGTTGVIRGSITNASLA